MEKQRAFDENINIILEIMDREINIIPAPRSEEILEILKIMYSEDEAAIGARMNTIPEPPGAIAERLSMEEKDLIPLLEKMADKGTVLRLGKKENYVYGIFPTDVGIFETCFGKGEDTEKTRHLAKLWTKYFDGPWGKVFHETQTPNSRIVPIEKKIPAKQEVLPYEKVSEIIEQATFRSVKNCACKSAKILSGKGCSLNAPTEVCMFFGDYGRAFVERGFAREVSREECYEIVKKAEDAGLVHLTYNVKNEMNVLCSCCPCCCVALRGITEFNKPDAVAHSSYVALIDRKVCDGCKNFDTPECFVHCPMDAISMQHDSAVANAGKCIGCGICAHFCPVEGAIVLKKRKIKLEPKEDLTDLVTGVLKERGMV